MSKDIEIANTHYGVARFIDQYMETITKAQETLKQREDQIHEDTKQVLSSISK